MTDSPAERRQPWLLLGLAAVVYGAALGTLQLGQGVDDGLYLSLGQGLRHGEGFRRHGDLARAPEGRSGPVLPAVVALTLRLSGDRLEATRLIPFTCALLTVLLAWHFFARRGRREALWPTALLAFNPFVVGYSGQVLTDLPFLLLGLASLVWLDRLDDAAGRGWAVVLGGLLGLLTLVRIQGLLLVGVTCLWLVARGRWRLALVAGLTAGALVGPWCAFLQATSGSPVGAGYQSDLTSGGTLALDARWRVFENLWRYASDLWPQTLTPFFGERVAGLLGRFGLGWLLPLLGLAVTAVSVAALLRPAVRREPAVWWAAALSGLILVWPWGYSRFCLPLLPAALLALTELARAGRRRLWAGLAACCLAGCLVRDVALIVHPPAASRIDLATTAAWLEATLPADAAVVMPVPWLLSPRLTRPTLQVTLPPAAADYPAWLVDVRTRCGGREPYLVTLSVERSGTPPAPPEGTALSPLPGPPGEPVRLWRWPEQTERSGSNQAAVE